MEEHKIKISQFHKNCTVSGVMEKLGEMGIYWHEVYRVRFDMRTIGSMVYFSDTDGNEVASLFPDVGFSIYQPARNVGIHQDKVYLAQR